MMGIDIEEVKRFRLKRTDRFIQTTFTLSELDYAFSRAHPEQHLCGFYCAKEALMKALDKPVLMKKIEIAHDKRGKPSFSTHKGYLVSISHTAAYAVAQVMRK